MANQPTSALIPSIVTLTDGVPTTTSLAIADGAEIQHKNVLELIRTYLADLEEFGGVAFETRKGSPLPQGGFAKATEVAILNEQQTTLLFTYMRNSEVVRAFKKRLVKEFFLLAEQARALAQFDLPKTFPEALRQLADSTERNQALEAKIAADQPKVAFAEAVRNLDGSCLVREFAKVLGTGQNRFFQQLREDGFLMANNEPYQEYLDRGWFVRVENVPFVDRDGKAHPTFTTRITGKGQVGLAKRYGKCNGVGV